MFIEFLKIFFAITGIFFSPLLIIYIPLFSHMFRDYFKSNQLKKELNNHNIESVHFLLLDLFATKQTDWHFQNNQLFYYPFPNQKMIYVSLKKNNEFNLNCYELHIYVKKHSVFRVHYYAKSKRFGIYNLVDSSISDTRRKDLGKLLIEHVTPFFEHYQNSFQKAQSEVLHEPHIDSSIINEASRPCYDLLNALLKEKRWLTDEQLHKIKYTYPKDLDSLVTLFNELKDTNSMEKHIASSFQDVYDSLISIEEDIETRKVQAIMTKKEVIKIR